MSTLKCTLRRLSFAIVLGLSLTTVVLLGLALTRAESLVTARPASNQASAGSPTGIITTVGRHLERDGIPFEVRGVNYYPKDYAWDRFWTNYTEALPQIRAELGRAKALGVNTVRIFLPYEHFDGSDQAQPHLDHLANFVNWLGAHDMTAIVTLFDFYASTSSAPYSTTDYLTNTRHISTVIHTLGITNPAVLAWDVKNELDREYTHFDKDEVKAWATTMISYIREVDSNHLVTIGFYGAITDTWVYSPAIAAEFASDVDFVSMHYFLPEGDFERVLQELQSSIGDKPIVLEEFGLHTMVAGDDPHTETEQAAYYNALLSLSEAHDVAGYLFWTLADFSYIIPGTQEPQHCLGILRNRLVDNCQVTTTVDYTEKPAACTICRHYDDRVAYLDLFDGWVVSDTDKPPPGWSDNWNDGGALLRGYNLSETLWSHGQGKVAFSKGFLSDTFPTTGLATSPMLTNFNVDRYPILAGQVYSYSIRDRLWGSDAVLHVGVQEGAQITRLLTITPGSTVPQSFRIDLRRPPTRWSGTRNFTITFELVPQGEGNGYSAAYEFDWIALESPAACDTLTDPLAIPLVINDTFGPRLLQPGEHSRYDFHRGIDWLADEGVPVYAVTTGTVRSFRGDWESGAGSGNFVHLIHQDDGYETRYNHLWQVHCAITDGLQVSPGQLIGWVGETGATYPHLHFEVRQGLNVTQRAAIHPLSTKFLSRTNSATPTVTLLGVYTDTTGLTALVETTSPYEEPDVTAVSVAVSGAATDSRSIDYVALNANTPVVADLDDPLVNNVCIVPTDLTTKNGYSVTMAFRQLDYGSKVTVTAQVTDVGGLSSKDVVSLVGGLEVTPAEQFARSAPGQTVTFVYTLTNHTGAPDTFTLTHLSAQGWPTANVASTKDGAHIIVTVEITLTTDRFGPPDCGLLLAEARGEQQRVVAGFYRIYRDAYVSGDTGSDTPGAGNMITPFKTIGYAIGQTDAGGTIRVAQGMYTENLTLKKTIHLLGGYDASSWTTRTLAAYSTTVNGNLSGAVLTINGDYGPLVEGFTFFNGRRDGAGGGVRLVGGAAPTLRSNWIVSNTAQKGGGGIYVGSYGTLPPTFVSITITGNTAINSSGGGIYIDERPVVIQESYILDNQTTNYGGGLYVKSGPALIQGNLISGNHAITNGGGIYLTGGAVAQMLDNRILGNKADYDGGGGALVSSDDVYLTNNVIQHNIAGDDGGGLRLYKSDATLTNTIIADNRAGTRGSGLYIRGSSPHLLHTTIARNCDGDGRGLYVTNSESNYSTVAMTNTILVSHTVGVYVRPGNTATLEATLWGTATWANDADWDGGGTIITGAINVWGDPAFVDPDAGDYHIGPGSAAIDGGVDAGGVVDIDGDPRQIDGDLDCVITADLGADEFLPLYPDADISVDTRSFAGFGDVHTTDTRVLATGLVTINLQVAGLDVYNAASLRVYTENDPADHNHARRGMVGQTVPTETVPFKVWTPNFGPGVEVPDVDDDMNWKGITSTVWLYAFDKHEPVTETQSPWDHPLFNYTDLFKWSNAHTNVNYHLPPCLDLSQPVHFALALEEKTSPQVYSTTVYFDFALSQDFGETFTVYTVSMPLSVTLRDASPVVTMSVDVAGLAGFPDLDPWPQRVLASGHVTLTPSSYGLYPYDAATIRVYTRNDPDDPDQVHLGLMGECDPDWTVPLKVWTPNLGHGIDKDGDGIPDINNDENWRDDEKAVWLYVFDWNYPITETWWITLPIAAPHSDPQCAWCHPLFNYTDLYRWSDYHDRIDDHGDYVYHLPNYLELTDRRPQRGEDHRVPLYFAADFTDALSQTYSSTVYVEFAFSSDGGDTVAHSVKVPIVLSAIVPGDGSSVNWLLNRVDMRPDMDTTTGTVEKLADSYQEAWDSSDAGSTYDQALMVIALTAAGHYTEAEQILNGLRYLQNDDGSWFFSYMTTVTDERIKDWEATDKTTLYTGDGCLTETIRGVNGYSDELEKRVCWDVTHDLPVDQIGPWVLEDYTNTICTPTQTLLPDKIKYRTYDFRKYAGANAWVVMAANYYEMHTGVISYHQMALDALHWLTHTHYVTDSDLPAFGAIPIGRVWNAADVTATLTTTYGFADLPVYVAEHNFDAYSAFGSMGKLTGDNTYTKTAEWAKKFLLQELWAPKVDQGKHPEVKSVNNFFFPGIDMSDQITGVIDTSCIYLDGLTWSILALGPETEVQDKDGVTTTLAIGLEFADEHLLVTGATIFSDTCHVVTGIVGYEEHVCNVSEAPLDSLDDKFVWSEGSEGIVAARYLAGGCENMAQANRYHGETARYMMSNGGVPYSTLPANPSDPHWNWTDANSIAGTAWFYFNERSPRVNPFQPWTQPPVVSITKQASPDLVQAGEQLTYTICVINTGDVTFTATITDILPAHVTPSGVLTWATESIEPNGIWITTTDPVTVQMGWPGPLTNVVEVTTDEGTVSVYTKTTDVMGLTVTKQANYDPVQAGEQLTYTICVTNTGNVILTAAITDILPAHVTPSGVLTWPTESIEPNGAWTRQFTVTVAWSYSGTLINVVQVTTEEGVTGIYTETSWAKVTPALTITKQASPDLVQAGEQLTYTIYVTNTGNVTLTATLTDILPAHVTPSGVLTWEAEITKPNGVWTRSFPVTVAWGYSGTLVNVAQVATKEKAAGIYTETSRAKVTPALTITKQAIPDLVQAGEQLTYTIYVTNTGNVTLTSTITDILPAHVTPSGVLTWEAEITKPNGAWTRQFTVTVAWSYSGTLVNVAQVATEEGVTGIYTETSWAKVTPALTITKQASPDLVQAGEQLTYTIYVTNTGNVTLTATITDTLPTDILSGQMPDGKAIAPDGQITWAAVITAPGDVWSETVVVTVETGYIGILTNIVEINTEEGAMNTYICTVTVPPYLIYLPVVLRNSPTTSFEYGVEGCQSSTTTTDDQFEIYVEGNDVVMHHYNAIYNCCATIVVDLIDERPLLKLVERETYPEGDPCYCVCPYNVSARVPDLPPGDYRVEVWNWDQSHRYGWAEVIVP